MEEKDSKQSGRIKITKQEGGSSKAKGSQQRRRKEKQGQDGLFNSSSEKNPKKKEWLTLVGRLANHRWATG